MVPLTAASIQQFAWQLLDSDLAKLTCTILIILLMHRLPDLPD